MANPIYDDPEDEYDDDFDTESSEAEKQAERKARVAILEHAKRLKIGELREEYANVEIERRRFFLKAKAQEDRANRNQRSWEATEKDLKRSTDRERARDEHDAKVTKRVDELCMSLHQRELLIARLEGYIERVNEDDLVRNPPIVTVDRRTNRGSSIAEAMKEPEK